MKHTRPHPPDRSIVSPILLARAKWLANFAHTEFKTPADKLWFFLRRRQLNGYRFRRNIQITPSLRADFYNHEARLVVLINSAPASITPGYTYLYFTSEEILANLPGILQRILIAARQRAGKNV